MHSRPSHLRIPAALLAVASLLFAACGREEVGPTYRIVGYANETIDSTGAARLTHLNYSFANIIDGEVVLGRPEQDASLRALQRVRRWNPDLKLLISVGGWSWSGGFSDAALSDESREKFARSAVRFMKTYELDGVDLDWEFPGQIGNNNVFRAEDKENFTLMLAECRRQLDEQSRLDGRAGTDPYLLTIASNPSRNYLNNTEMAEVARNLDFVNIMTYDFHGTWTPITGHHTNLSASAAVGATEMNSRKGAEDHITEGVPADKVVLGVAFYGRAFSGAQSDQYGLYQPYDTERAYSYHTMAADFIDKNGFERRWDESAEAPYLWNDSLLTFITYDDPESLRLKAEFVRERGLGGVMFWHYNHDTTGVLLGTLHEGLRSAK